MNFRGAAVAAVVAAYDDGTFLDVLRRRVVMLEGEAEVASLAACLSEAISTSARASRRTGRHPSERGTPMISS